jgi:prepilin-type N-terminal cleavage/methylation domain-containing protein
MIRSSNLSARRGYTLVELLVVMSLIILLAALALGVVQSGMFGSQKVISATDRASGWLLISKQRAMRDGAPRGVRFFSAPGNINAYTEAQYIEQPEAWVPNPAQEGNPTGARIIFVYEYAPTGTPYGAPSTPSPAPFFVKAEIYFVSSNTADLDEYDQRVRSGDFLNLPELNKSLVIVNPNATVAPSFTLALGTGTVTLPNANARRITVASISDPLPTATPATYTNQTEPFKVVGLDLSAAGTARPTSAMNPHQATMTTFKYGFQSAPRALLGEPTLQLTGGTAIDYRYVNLNAPFAPNSPLTPTSVGPDGYRTWSNPGPGLMAAPFNPPTTIGVQWQLDPTSTSGGRYFDILFSPTGQVTNNSTGLICLWVRDTSKGVAHPRQLDTTGFSDCDPLTVYNDAGQQALVVIYTRNGLIATQEINPPPAAPTVGYDPYSFAKDGINNGL